MVLPVLQDASSPESHSLSSPESHSLSIPTTHKVLWVLKMTATVRSEEQGLKYALDHGLPGKYFPESIKNKETTSQHLQTYMDQLLRPSNSPWILLSALAVWPYPSRSQNEWRLKETLFPTWVDVEMNVAWLATQKMDLSAWNCQQSKPGRQQHTLPSCLRWKPCIIWLYFCFLEQI